MLTYIRWYCIYFYSEYWWILKADTKLTYHQMIGLSQMATLPNLEQQIPSQIYAHRKKIRITCSRHYRKLNVKIFGLNKLLKSLKMFVLHTLSSVWRCTGLFLFYFRLLFWLSHIFFPLLFEHWIMKDNAF